MMSLRHRLDGRSTAGILVLAVIGAVAPQLGCVLSTESLGGSSQDSEDDTGGETSAATTAESGPGVSNTSLGGSDTGLGEESTVGTSPTNTGSDDDSQETFVCESIAHASCHAAMVAACDPLGPPTPDCVTTTDGCYPFGPPALSRPAMYLLCSVELEESCAEEGSFSCGQTYCECVAGAGPYHWDNCFQTVSSACVYSQDSDCEGALQTCFPGSTRAEFEACAGELHHDCDCPKCGRHEECQEEVTACLQR